MTEQETQLKSLREKIDRLDKELVRLLNERATVVLEVGRIKKQNQGRTQVFVPHREREVYERVAALNQGPLLDKTLRAVYREIMSGSLALEKELAVAFLGPVGTFSSMASRAKFGDSVDYLPQRGIADVFKEVDQERADYGVVPVENSTGGAIDDTLDAFCQYSRIRIVGEILLEVHLNLLSNGPLEKIQRVYTMRPPYEQCKGWLSNHLPQAKIVEVSSTAQAAEAAAKEENAAAIASLEAATLYGVEVRASAIEDQTFNVTRFLVIGKHDAQPTGHDKTSVIVSIKDGIGALQDMLLPLKTYGINMTRIESRPARQGSWDYLFFMDFQGHAKEEKVAAALKEMGETTRRLTVLGSYPAANG